MITYAEVMARYRSNPAVSQIWALIVRPFSSRVLVLNSTPIVVLLSWLNSFLVKRESKLLLPTPDSPMRTTGEINTEVIIHRAIVSGVPGSDPFSLPAVDRT